jgi:hypothetical protein
MNVRSVIISAVLAFGNRRDGHRTRALCGRFSHSQYRQRTKSGYTSFICPVASRATEDPLLGDVCPLLSILGIIRRSHDATPFQGELGRVVGKKQVDQPLTDPRRAADTLIRT